MSVTEAYGRAGPEKDGSPVRRGLRAKPPELLYRSLRFYQQAVSRHRAKFEKYSLGAGRLTNLFGPNRAGG